MSDPIHEPDDLGSARHVEYQDAHYHDEELEIQMDEGVPRSDARSTAPAPRKKNVPRPPPPRRYWED